MVRDTIRTGCCATTWVLALLACGGAGATQPTESRTIAEPEPEPEPVAEVTPPPEEDEPEPEPEPPPPDPPPPEPVVATNADELLLALRAAATDVEALRRLVSPEHGIGVYAREEDIIQHHCDVARLASLPGLGFVIGESDRFRCDRDLSRCSVADADGSGHVFYLGHGPGDVIWIDTIVQYPRRVPSTDSAAVRAFARAGAGVCGLWRSLTDTDRVAPEAFSVFVSSQTGLVPEVVAQQLCGDEAAAAFDERLAPLLRAAPTRCDRNPTRCTFTSTDTATTIYGGEDGPTAVAITRPGMVRNLDRAQEHDLDAFLHGLARHSCDDD